jgi:hypothetical protein
LRIRTSKFGLIFARIRVFADLAQLVEQFIRNEKVASSIPAIGTKYKAVTLFETRFLSEDAGFFFALMPRDMQKGVCPRRQDFQRSGSDKQLVEVDLNSFRKRLIFSFRQAPLPA